MQFNEFLIQEIVGALSEIVVEGRFADTVIGHRLRENAVWRGEERSLYATTVYGILKHLRRLYFVVVGSKNDVPTKPHFQQIVVAWCVLKKHSVPKSHSLPDIRIAQRRWDEASGSRVLRLSLPNWLDELCFDELGEDWGTIAESLQKEPPQSVRINTLKTTIADMESRFKLRHIKMAKSELAPHGFTVVGEHVPLFNLPEFKDGFFEQMDIGSQCISPMLDLKEGMRVVDACAGSGGKSLHIAMLMRNKGKVICMDTENWKLQQLTKRLRRAGVSCIETRHIHSTKVVKRLESSADRVLLDVPCSGTGVFRRNPDSKWHLQAKDFPEFVEKQRQILEDYSTIAKPGGLVVYSTCSVLPSEGEACVADFLASNSNFELLEERRLSPVINNTDGFYIAKLKRLS